MHADGETAAKKTEAYCLCTYVGTEQTDSLPRVNVDFSLSIAHPLTGFSTAPLARWYIKMATPALILDK